MGSWVLDNLANKILQRVTVETNGCWLWTGPTQTKGYGLIYYKGKTHLVHRAVYSHMYREITHGLVIDHLCKITNCVNPEHLELVTPSVNVLRGDHQERKITHCPRGHMYDDANTLIYRNKRFCKACRDIRNRNRKYGRLS